MRVLIAGSGAVAFATAQELLQHHHCVQMISSQDLGAPYPAEGFFEQCHLDLTRVRTSTLSDELKKADAVFCCGSLNMLRRFLSVSGSIDARVYYLTSWHDTLKSFYEQGPFDSTRIIPFYPAFACEIVGPKLVLAGIYRLEVAHDYLDDMSTRELVHCLSRLGLSFRMMSMETRFRAHFSRTQFAYWYLSHSFVGDDALDSSALALVHLKWQVVVSCCRDHPDLCLPLSSFLLGLKLSLDSPSPATEIALVVASLLTSKSYKLDYFLRPQLN